MKYDRSNTGLDRTAVFMPQTMLARIGAIGRFSGSRGLGALGDDWSGMDDWGASYDPAYYYETDPANQYPTDYTYYPPSTGAIDTVPATPPFIAEAPGSGFNWSQLPAMLKDTYIALKTGDAQSKLLDINLERAKRGMTPIDARAYMPGVNVGLAPGLRNMVGGIGVGTLALGAAGIYFLTRRKSSRR